MKVVYFSHPYGADENNLKLAAQKLYELHQKNPEVCYVSPLHNFSFLPYDFDENYAKGLAYCLVLLKACDSILVGSDNWEESKGCCAEVAYAYAEGIPVEFL